MGEHTKTERIFICPHFCLEILPSKFLPCKLTLWGEEVKTLANFYLPPTVYWDFYRHFTLKKHQFLPRQWGKQKKGWHFFKSNNNSVKFFSQNRFTRAFVLPFATYPTFTATAATRPYKRKKGGKISPAAKRVPQSPFREAVKSSLFVPVFRDIFHNLCDG